MKVLFWQDKAPDFDLNGLTEYVAYAMFAEVMEALQDRIDAKRDAEMEDEKEGEE